MKLTAEQKDFFTTFGFIKFPQLFADRLEWIIHEFTHTFPNTNVHDGSKRTCVVPFIDQRMSTLLDDPRIEEIGSALLGKNFNYMGSDGNYYTGDTRWHRDGNHPKYKHLKIAFYLDKIDGNFGALRVIPGSHRLDDQFGKDLGQKTSKSDEFWGIDGSNVPAVALDVIPGDALVFDHNIFHSSWKGNTSRRMFTINLCERYEDQDIQKLRDYLSGASRFWLDRSFGETMMNTAPHGRMIHLEQVMANDGHLAALSAERRKTESEPARG